MTSRSLVNKILVVLVTCCGRKVINSNPALLWSGSHQPVTDDNKHGLFLCFLPYFICICSIKDFARVQTEPVSGYSHDCSEDCV